MMQWSKELNYERAGEASAKKLQPSNIINIIVMYLCLKIHPFFDKLLRCFLLVSPFPWFHFREDKSQTSVVFLSPVYSIRNVFDACIQFLTSFLMLARGEGKMMEDLPFLPLPVWMYFYNCIVNTIQRINPTCWPAHIL